MVRSHSFVLFQLRNIFRWVRILCEPPV